MTGGDARLQQRAQAGQAGAVADQDQRAVVVGRMEGGIAAHAQVDARVHRRMFGQPAAAAAEASVGMAHLPHQQLQAAVGRAARRSSIRDAATAAGCRRRLARSGHAHRVGRRQSRTREQPATGARCHRPLSPRFRRRTRPRPASGRRRRRHGAGRSRRCRRPATPGPPDLPAPERDGRRGRRRCRGSATRRSCRRQGR